MCKDSLDIVSFEDKVVALMTVYSIDFDNAFEIVKNYSLNPTKEMFQYISNAINKIPNDDNELFYSSSGKLSFSVELKTFDIKGK